MSMDALIRFAMHVADVLFFAGLAGASVVVVLSFIEDCKDLLGEK